MDSAPEEAETPWAFAKRLLAEGHSVEHVRERLRKDRGLAPDDIALLLGEQVAASTATASGESAFHPDLFIGLALMAAGAMAFFALGSLRLSVVLFASGLWRAVASLGRGAPRTTLVDEAASVPEALDPSDPAPRCAKHATARSIGACPRCGAFCCVQCAPRAGFTGDAICHACASNPEIVAAKDKAARRWSAAAVLAFGAVEPALVVFAELMGFDSSASTTGLVLLLTFLVVPFVLLAAVQAVVQTIAPLVIAGVIAGALTVATILSSESPLPILFFGAALLFAFIVGSAQRERRKSRVVVAEQSSLRS